MERSPDTGDYLRASRPVLAGNRYDLAAIAASIPSVARTPVYNATATVSVRSDFNGAGPPSSGYLRGMASKEAALVVTQPAVLAAASRALGDRTPQ